jgi:hypothetical protein
VSYDPIHCSLLTAHPALGTRHFLKNPLGSTQPLLQLPRNENEKTPLPIHGNGRLSRPSATPGMRKSNVRAIATILDITGTTPASSRAPES